MTTHGQFISIPFNRGSWRVRESSILAYSVLDQSAKDGTRPEDIYILRIDCEGMQTIGLPYDTLGALEAMAARLDQFFKERRP